MNQDPTTPRPRQPKMRGAVPAAILVAAEVEKLAYQHAENTLNQTDLGRCYIMLAEAKETAADPREFIRLVIDALEQPRLPSSDNARRSASEILADELSDWSHRYAVKSILATLPLGLALVRIAMARQFAESGRDEINRLIDVLEDAVDLKPRKEKAA